MKRAIVFLCVMLAVGPARASQPVHPDAHVIVIGIDGMDPDLLRTFMSQGRMPNFKALIEEGALLPLRTSIPPQSPVAWSNFITGTDPGSHGIFDFIHRDPATYMPIFSAAETRPPGKTLSLGDWVFPLSGGGTVLLRHGEAFWETLEHAGVDATMIRVPANYPPSPTRQQTLAGMGTPDLLGSYGTFTFYTDDPQWEGASVGGGRVRMVHADNGRVLTAIDGPPNTLRKSQPALQCTLTIDVDADNDAVRVTVGHEEAFLRSGEWSRWVPVTFDLLGPFRKLHGMCRFHLESTSPLRLYASPVNVDPRRPALPISTPDDFAPDLAARAGPYYTQGIAEDTKALESGVFDDAEFVTQTDTILAERARVRDVLLYDYHDGLLFLYVSTIDQSCHALWRDADSDHPAHVDGNGFEDRFGHLYEEMDQMLGEIRERVPNDATLIVLSDHGFAPYYKKVNLNTWLLDNGYLNLIRPEDRGRHPLFGNVFWRRTRAYAVGLNGLYVNMVGREGKGIVPRGPQYDALLDELTEKLLALRDPENGERVITNVERASRVYHGPFVARAPDLIVGYNRGYRCSDDSALGTLTRDVLTPNLGKWTGDHCMDHNLVPGVLISNRRIAVVDPSLLDVPVTIIRLFGVQPPEAMHGRYLFYAGDSGGPASH